MEKEKVGDVKSEIYYSYMARKLYGIDPLFRGMLFAVGKISPAFKEKLLFLHHNESFTVYRLKKWPPVSPVTDGYRYEIVDRDYRSNV